ncbi:MAG TPA: hypothetical protein DCY94_04470, partial [Firmicutes bacterium]|nr:hypothetical protein [Bacillota bacterium]
MDLKKKIMIGISALMVVVVGAIGSYAYFSSGIQNNKNMAADLKTGTMALTFEDNDNGINAKLAFGESAIKKFKIINTGSVDASMSLDWDRLVNTYMNRSLSYNLTYATSADGEYKEIIPETNMPVSDKPISQSLAGELSVPAGATYYYNLEISLNDLPDVDQTDDLDAVFNTNFAAQEASRYRYYTLTVDPNGGTWGEFISSQEYQLMNKETMTITGTPEKAGYTFAGWKVIGASSTLADGTFTMGISNTVLKAEWTPNTYSLTYDLNGGSITGSTTIDVQYKTPTSIETPTKEGYTFTGWTSEDGRVENDKFILTKIGNATITANWEVNNYKYIVYHHKQNVDDDEYTLVGADTDEGEAAYNSTVSPEVKIYVGFTSPSVKSLTIGHETVYPPVINKVDYNYDRNKYTLTIDANGGTYSGSTSQELKYEQSIELLVPVKTGYNFTNWSKSAGELVDSTFTMGTSAATVTANYTAKEVAITFNANGGSTPTSSKTVQFDSEYGELPTPTYEGYQFVGWFTEASNGEQVLQSTVVSTEGPQTLYAQWRKAASTEATLEALKVTPNSGTPTFANVATTDEGVYSMQDDYGTSYYFRGAVENNYVKFGGFFWRIIRINGDGSIRMIYDGTQAWPNGNGQSTFTTSGNDRVTHTSKQWNANYGDAKYVGWM